MVEQTFRFTVTVIGTGEDLSDAWDDAILALAMEPGTPNTYQELDPETFEAIGAIIDWVDG